MIELPLTFSSALLNRAIPAPTPWMWNCGVWRERCLLQPRLSLRSCKSRAVGRVRKVGVKSGRHGGATGAAAATAATAAIAAGTGLEDGVAEVFEGRRFHFSQGISDRAVAGLAEQGGFPIFADTEAGEVLEAAGGADDDEEGGVGCVGGGHRGRIERGERPCRAIGAGCWRGREAASAANRRARRRQQGPACRVVGGSGGMADALDLGSSGATRGGSSPPSRTLSRKLPAGSIPCQTRGRVLIPPGLQPGDK